MTNQLAGIIAILFCSLFGMAQDIHVSAMKGGIVLSMPAQTSYKLMAGEEKRPQLTLECVPKGKKNSHILLFIAGGALAEDSPETAMARNAEETLLMTINGTKQTTTWVPYGDPQTFAYYGKTEPERAQFLETLMKSGTVAIDFKPFLSGMPVTAVFDLSKLREEMSKHPECSGL